MFSSKFATFTNCIRYSRKYLHKSVINYCKPPKFENPIERTFRILKDDFKNYKILMETRAKGGVDALIECPNHVDIVIIGGGAMGSSIAYWLKEMSGEHGLRILVVEKDPTYKKCSSSLTLGGLNQQFSQNETIQMCLFASEFLRTIKRRFGPQANIQYTPGGYLMLANEENGQRLMDSSILQNNLGAVNTILTPEKLKEKFPWMNVDDIAVGCLGLEKEGWFNSSALLNLFRNSAKELGTTFMHGEVISFNRSEDTEESSNKTRKQLTVQLPSGNKIPVTFACCIIAAGHESANIAQLASIGTGNGVLALGLPIEKRKRHIFRFICEEDPPGINAPMTIDYTGCHFRRDELDGGFLCDLSTIVDSEQSANSSDVDRSLFYDEVLPKLANRVPAFKSVKVDNAWSTYYDYNFYDENGIIGNHPYFDNILFATGFSGHSIQVSMAVGRAISELILEGRFSSIDLKRLMFHRFLSNSPMYEIGAI